ncbi:aminotransferase class IV family protein, partial [Devosia sp.]|uniref:aminotransferase class IV family protein n=1 Tax=Devosia sp. TaxID=1871048 RepID=UPI002AFE27CF
GVYTGSIGHFAPNGDLPLNVAIRTAVIDADGRGEIGIGGGIVADSQMNSEYREALLKMAFFTAPAVTLIETLLWREGEGYDLLGRHLDRLAASAAHFGLACDRAAIEALLQGQDYSAAAMRVRLTLDASGPTLTAMPLPPNPDVFRFTLAPEPLDSQNPFLAHKTTNRDFYDQPRQSAQAQWGVDEVVFTNERGELTEGSITNLFIERNGKLLTPPLASGLLPGTLRAELLATGKAEEAVLGLDDLESAEKIWLGNSVRGLMRAQWVKP